MPSIIVKEIDKTSSPLPEYANFSVVVPGQYDISKTDLPFDTNGIYECNDADEFEELIGLVAATETSILGEYAKPLEKQIEPETELTFNNLYVRTVDELKPRDFYKTYDKQVYKFTVSDTEISAGKLVFKFKDAGAENYKYYKFELLQEYPTEVIPMVVIQTGNEGRNATPGFPYRFMGNQIAYELLQSGYTVLYKKVNYNEDKITLKLSELDTSEYWECLLDKSAYDFRYIILSGYNSPTAQNEVASIARYLDSANSGRGDCSALLDIDDSVFKAATSQSNAAELIKVAANSIQNADKNTAFFAPSLVYNMTVKTEYAGNKIFPASFNYLVCASKAAINYAEWYAVAGYTRGISNYTISKPNYKFGDIAANILAPREADDGIRCVNLVITEKNNYYLWGNRTAEKLDTNGLKASHFLNVRQLCTTIKKAVYVICRNLTFDPNSESLWTKFCYAISPTLDRMKTDQGISNYKLVKVINREKAKLTAIIRIVPIEAVEDFEITLSLEDDLSGNITANIVE